MYDQIETKIVRSAYVNDYKNSYSEKILCVGQSEDLQDVDSHDPRKENCTNPNLKVLGLYAVTNSSS